MKLDDYYNINNDKFFIKFEDRGESYCRRIRKYLEMRPDIKFYILPAKDNYETVYFLKDESSGVITLLDKYFVEEYGIY